MSILNEVILVTGGCGFLGSTTLTQLLKSGYSNVRTTSRDAKKQEGLLSSLKRAGVTDDQLKCLQFFVTDLLSDSGWKEAFEGVKYLLHIASPMAFFEKDKIKTASEGHTRVLRFARDAGVKRVIVTSSGLVFQPVIKAASIGALVEYHESKIVADTAVWDFTEKEGGNLEVISIYPRIMFGPILGPDNARQAAYFLDFLNGKLHPMAARGGPIMFCDVRDVADLHIRALTASNLTVGKGQGKAQLWAFHDKEANWTQISQILRDKLPADYGKNVPLAPTPEGTPAGEKLGDTSLSKALGWKPHTIEETILDTANSLIALGLVKN